VFADGPDYQTMLGSIDYAFLFAYAIGMFIRYTSIGLLLALIFRTGFFLSVHVLAQLFLIHLYFAKWQKKQKKTKQQKANSN